MLTCVNCQFVNPVDHKFCQRCGEPLIVSISGAAPPVLQVRLVPPDGLVLTPDSRLGNAGAAAAASEQAADKSVQAGRYQVLTILSQGHARVVDQTPTVRSPLQKKLNSLSTTSFQTLKSIPDLPEAAYPYLLLPAAAPSLYDVWQQAGKTLLIVSEQSTFSSIIEAFSTAIDPLQHVYWMYQLTDLWAALSPIPQWRSSLLLADNLCLDAEQSVCVRDFIPTDAQSPQLSDLKVFLKSLLAQPHRGAVETLRQVRQLVLTVSAAETLEQLSAELANMGESLLSTPAAITPTATTSVATRTPATAATSTLASAAVADMPLPITLPPNAMSANTQPANTQPANTQPEPMENNPPPQDSSAVPPQETSASSLEKDILEDRLLETTVLQDPADSDDLSEGSESTMVLPMKLVAIEDAGQTDVGRQRDHNEDCFFISRYSQKRSDNKGHLTVAHGLYILCDGMGGHAGGEVASQLAAKTLSDYFDKHWPMPLPHEVPKLLPEEAVVVEAVKLANQAIYEVNEQEKRAGHERMGTTLVMVLLQGTKAVVAHVGDSRLYQHGRRVGLQQITTDHEVGQREMQRGVDEETAYARSDAYQLTQALGPRGAGEVEPSVTYFSFSEDTLLLLCSDGLSDNDVVEDYLESHIDPLLRGGKELATGVDDLVQLSNEVNGHDNITAIAVRIQVSPDLAKGGLL